MLVAVRGRFWVGLWLLAVLAALWAVIARSTAGLRLARELDAVRREHAQLAGRKAALERQLGRAQSRAVLVPRAQAQLHLRLPADSEIVLLPLPAGGDR